MPCIKPIRLQRLTGSDAAIVPCGKCPECLRHKANELAVRIVREVDTSKDFYFVTLTYDNGKLPVAMSAFDVNLDTGEFNGVGDPLVLRPNAKNRPIINEFLENADYEIVYSNGKAVKKFRPYFTYVDGRYVCLYHSVCNSDVQKFLKRVRKKLGPGKHFKYVLVPEYGGNTFRPHYHILLIGLSKRT